MTEIEQKALALVNEVISADQLRILPQYVDKAVLCEALCRAIEQHEQFKREVSDAIIDCGAERYLGRFILPKPKPDPLVEAVNEAWGWRNPHSDVTDQLRAALAKRNAKIVWEAE